MLRRILGSLALTAAVSALAAPAEAQSCSDLTITGPGTSGSTLTIAITGADPDRPVVLFLSGSTGSISFDIGPLGTLELGLAAPAIPLLIGRTDANGDFSVSTAVRGQRPRIDLNAQATTSTFSLGTKGPPSVNFCVSDVEQLSVGG